ncbi:Tll0287-like domain-containing protein [Arundinibacter roseus]|uniref:DUF3365 domain-containing protein n=1 Tax=Arundinibacter roseus TaxID=2070510 RepID=A0A4R4KJA0_9BACT|nr:DUF3365 domain-containing protein [Arundinibacter roseus]TDB66916.1 DUF3365 domain-containing protein [Arundinibacter roseus]
MKNLSLTLLLGFSVLVSCQNKITQPPSQIASASGTTERYQTLGDSLSQSAQKAVMQALMKAISEKGTAHAVDFCNTNALPILAGQTAGKQIRIERISEKYRNPADKPTLKDLPVLHSFAKKHADKEPLKPILIENKKQAIYFKPILVAMPTCLKCHGDPTTDIEPTTLRVIQEKYPDDRATGYASGDFRGLWKITFLK